jgi:hypothetical protein
MNASLRRTRAFRRTRPSAGLVLPDTALFLYDDSNGAFLFDDSNGAFLYDDGRPVLVDDSKQRRPDRYRKSGSVRRVSHDNDRTTFTLQRCRTSPVARDRDVRERCSAHRKRLRCGRRRQGCVADRYAAMVAGRFADGRRRGVPPSFYRHVQPGRAPGKSSAYDDECSGAAINAKWTTWDPAAYQTRTASPGSYTYRLTGTGNAADRQGGLRQAVPASEFCFAAKVGFYNAGALGRWLSTGIFVAGDIATNPATAAVEIAQITLGTSATVGDFSISYNAWTNYQTSGASRGTFPCIGTHAYMRGRINGTTCSFDWSSDGRAWCQLGSAVAGFTPAYFGFSFNNVLNAVNRGAQLEWFRVLGTGAGSSTFGALYPGVVGF